MTGSKALRVVALVVAIAACSELGSFRLSASNLEIGPNPAMPGDQVVASFILLLAPVQRHTVILIINNMEHSRVTRDETPPLPYIITLGDAAGLIATYGAGVHSARVEVRAEEEGESARTQTASFELREAAP